MGERTFCFCFIVSLIGSITALIYAYNILLPQVEPQGELALWYSVATCFSASASFSIAGRGDFDTYTMRPVVPGALPGNACPIIPSESPPITITLETSDGWRHGASYVPVLMLPASAYATVTIEVVDNHGTVVFPSETLSIGPDDGFPWMAPASDVSSAPAIGTAYGANGASCTDACPYASDGFCDDGGPGAEYAHCELASDCSDCGARTYSGGSGRRLGLVEATANTAAARSIGYATDDAGDLAMLPLADTSHMISPRGRRLLKGGGGSHGGRSTVLGSGRWGGQDVRRVRRTPSASSTYNGRVYGGAAVYMVAGRRYNGGSREYEYSQAANVYGQHQSILIVGSEGYGCYSCMGAERTCQGCPSDCTRREDCAGERATDVPFALDRYEIDLPLSLPSASSDRWPLRMHVVNASLVATRGHLPVSTSDILISFYTEEGLWFQKLADTLIKFGWVVLVATFCLPLCVDEHKDKRRRQRRMAQEKKKVRALECSLRPRMSGP